jgi:hypothetical protein
VTLVIVRARDQRFNKYMKSWPSNPAVLASQRDEPLHRKDRGGAAFFYLMAVSFVGLMTFVLWYVPRHF